ncbi:MAG TPA: DUF6599 family protein [Pyrinomonadaceae bacterium]|nr:DUF6599 family protein [Pyrinomonadaceae bacterium]
MPIKSLSRLLSASLLIALLSVAAAAQTLADAADKFLPERLGNFRAQTALRADAYRPEPLTQEDFHIVSTVAREYAAPDGAKFRVLLFNTRSNAAAFSLLRADARRHGALSAGRAGLIEGLDVVGHAEDGRVRFIKGTTLVEISGQSRQRDGANSALALARALSEKIEGAAGEIPVLVEHLPDRASVDETVGFAVSLPALQSLAGGRPALDVLSFEGGAEAATAVYGGGARLVVVEYTTPQYASDNDARIKERIAQLRSANQPVPTSYRRTGNYSVFVFDAPGEAAAAQLSDRVKYEKDVRWLDYNPHVLERAQAAYGVMTGNVILTSLKITALSIILCLGIGGAFGGAVFLYRRAQSATTEVYSDAGGMVRLNIDDMTAETDPARLLGRGER